MLGPKIASVGLHVAVYGQIFARLLYVGRLVQKTSFTSYDSELPLGMMPLASTLPSLLNPSIVNVFPVPV
jgi:hypothetical protein